VTDNSIIQDAREALAKWRDGSTPGPWEDYGGYVAVPGYVIANGTERDIPLIVGTAGNPELLDVIDRMLQGEADADIPDPYIFDLAAAILAADERMSA